ncbi:MAG: phage tail tape measure protein [Pseudomonadota bacterium]
MADLEKSVAIIFEGVDQMGAGVDSATRKIDSIAGSVESATRPLADFTADVLQFEAALLTTGAAATAFAVKLAGDFDAQFREISTLIDAPTDALSEFRGEILAYSSDSTQALGDINSAVYNAISAGVEYTDSLDAVRQSEQLAVAGRADLDQSLTVLVSSLNAYGEEMTEAERYSDLLFQTVRSGQTTLPELGASLSQVTSTAANAGVEFDELLAAIATITAGGAPTSQAVTQVRAAISSLIKPTSDATSLAEELGIEFNAAALKSEGLQGVLEEVERATGGNVEQIGRLFSSQEALNGALSLSGQSAERFAGNLEDMAGSAGATAEAYDRMADDISLGGQRIENAMRGALIAVGDPLLDEFGGIQQAIAEIFNAIGDSVQGGQLEGFVDQLESMFEGMEETLRDVARNLPDALEQADFSSFFDGIEQVRDAVASLFEGADLTSAEGLASVIETIGLGFETLSAYSAGAIQALGPFLEQLAELAGWLLELEPSTVAAAGAVGGLALALNTLSNATTAVTGVMRAFAGKGGVVASSAGILRTLVGVLTGPLGLVAAAGVAGKGVADMVTTFTGLDDRVDEATQEITRQNKAIDEGRLVYDYAIDDWVKAGEAQMDLAEWTRQSRRELTEMITGVDRQADAREREARMMAEVNAKYTDYDAMVEQAVRNSESFADEQERTAESLRGMLEEIGPLGEAWSEAGSGAYGYANNLADLQDAHGKIQAAFNQGLIDEEQFDELTEYYEAMRNGADEGARAQQALASEVLESEEAILKARDAVLEQERALEELASNERIKNLEIAVGLETARLEADTARIEAAFDSVDNTISDTGETLRGLTNNLAAFSSTSSSGYREMLELVQNEEERRDKAIDAQAKLFEAQAESLQARTEAMQNGDGLIKIDSDGLEPALEMIMWQIIEKVQLRANAEAAEFLVGIGGAE